MKDDLFNIGPKNAGDRRLNGKYKQAWVEESFSFAQPINKQVQTPGTKNFLGSSFSEKKLRFFFWLTLVGLMIIFGRIFYLQIIQNGYYAELAENNRLRLRPIPSERGLIFDRENKAVVQNIPSFSLSIVPQDFPRDKAARDNIIERVSRISGVPAEDISNLVKKYGAYSYESLTVKENLDYDSALKLYIQNADLPGILIEKGTKRLYGADKADNLPSLSHIIGYEGKLNEEELATLKNKDYLFTDYLGKVGLEKTYEAVLRGRYGQKKIEVDALGREQNVLAEEPPTPGKNLIMNIDLEAQQKMESLLKKSLERTGKKRAAGIALDPRTGEVIALVSWPTFDNNDFSNGISSELYQKYVSDENQPLFNRAIAGTYPSGSTVKMMIAAAALEEGIITPRTTVLSTGGLQVDKWFFKDWLAGGHGLTNVTKAIAWSINTFFYYIGGGYKNFVGLGVDKIEEYLKKFSVGKKTGIDLPGESDGFVPTKEWKEKEKGERWYVGDTYNLSIGQGDLLVTPLQVAVWTAAVANGGKVMEPHVVGAIVDPVDKTRVEIKPKVINQNFISPANMDVVKQGMRDCVVYGSCQLLKTLPFASGGKTGTAQWSSSKSEHAWFTSFAPFQQPQIVVTILVEEGGEGSSAAMPVARDFLSWWGQKYLK